MIEFFKSLRTGTEDYKQRLNYLAFAIRKNQTIHCIDRSKGVFTIVIILKSNFNNICTLTVVVRSKKPEEKLSIYLSRFEIEKECIFKGNF